MTVQRLSLLTATAWYVVLAGGCVVAHDALAKPAQQVWSGNMRQVDVSAEKSYPMTLTFKGGKGYSEYPELKCGGVWKRIGSVGKQYEIYLEHITHGTEVKDGTGGCIDGVVTLAVKGDKAVLGWFASVEGAPSLASATLSLQGK